MRKMPDWWVWTGGWYQENGEENYYYNHPLTEDSVVLEVGSYRGKFAKNISERYHCTVIGYEPSSYSFAAALKETSGLERVMINNVGMGHCYEERILYDTHRDGANIFRDSSDDGKSPPETIQIVDVASVVRAIGDIDLFVINCEGCEFVVFERLIEEGLIGNLDRIMIQWHLAEDRDEAWQWRICDEIAKTHLMEWNLGAWELWRLR